ncbi:MAG TPA: hypothetical protein VN858_01255 [Casimicrobiaceae bacterium]|nr:hypothetical protein [Casimicrobiaceae bacterium]
MLRIAVALLIALGFAAPLQAQVDPFRRDLVEIGYDQPLQGHAPVGAYVFYYLSRPQFGDADHALRIALSPVYVDGEWAVRHVFDADTDVGIGVHGGGFADDYDEIRHGRWVREQSFTGHDGGIDASLYHLFNPGQRVPLNAILQGGFRYVAFERDGRNPPDFRIPEDQPIARLRAGLRFGGIEPVLAPDMAAELSLWYEGEARFDPGPYGFDGDRRVQSRVQRFWARGLFVYTLPQSLQRFSVDVTGGASVHPDRLGAWRIGGVLPLDNEFPLRVPGYYEGEFSACNFLLVGADYSVPFDPAQRWRAGIGAAAARIDYTPGLAEPHRWISGVSASIGYAPATKAWKASLVYGHGFDAIRDGHRGADTVTVLAEFDLERMGYLRSDATSARPAD